MKEIVQKSLRFNFHKAILRYSFSNKTQNKSTEEIYDPMDKKIYREIQQDFKLLKQKKIHIPQHLKQSTSLEQIYYWAQNVKQLDQIIRIVQAINHYQKKFNIKDIRYALFQQKLIKYILVFPNIKDVLSIAKMAFKVQTTSEQLWYKLQKRFLKQYSLLTNQQKIQFISCLFLSQRQSKYFYVKVQQIFKPLIKAAQLSIQESINLSMILYETKQGSKELVLSILQFIFNNIQKVTFKQIGHLCTVVYAAKEGKVKLSKCQQLILQNNWIQNFALDDIYQIGKSLLYTETIPQLSQLLQQKYLELIQKQEEQFDLNKLAISFLNKYRFSIKGFKRIEHRIRKQINSAHPNSLCYLYKYLYIMQLQHHDFMIQIQNFLRYYLQDDKLLIQILAQVVHSFCMTRTGSREFYKFLQKIIYKRLDEIIKNEQIHQKIYNAYYQSNLCSAQFLKDLQYYL